MLRNLIASLTVSTALALGACSGEREPNPYPGHAKTTFNAQCPAGDPVCDCTWDQVTRTMTYEEYQSALDRFRTEGLMEPRITRARTVCLDRTRRP